jgi:hypothetical protein
MSDNIVEVSEVEDIDIEYDGWYNTYILTMPNGERYKLSANKAEKVAFQILEQLKIYED